MDTKNQMKPDDDNAVIVPLGDNFRALAVDGRSALNPGLNDQVFGWVGRYAGQLRMQNGDAAYRVRLNQEHVLVAQCFPVTREDLKNKDLKRELNDLLRKTKNPQGQLQEKLAEELVRLLDEKRGFSYPGTGLFRYTHDDRPALLWCWGYRRDEDTLVGHTPVLCPKCHYLRLQKANEPPVCAKGCGEVPPPDPVPKPKRWLALAAVLLLALVGGGAWWHFNKDQENPIDPVDPPPVVVVEESLEVRPSETVSLPVGAKKRFQVTHVKVDGSEEDVSDRVSIEVQDERYAQMGKDGQIQATATGSTEVAFRLGDLDTRLQLRTGIESPQHIWLAPETVELGVGTTKRLRVLGSDEPPETADESQVVDLSGGADWSVDGAQQLYVYYGLLEGLAPGKDVVVTATHPDADEPLAATVHVMQEQYDDLTLSPAASRAAAGQSIGVTATVHAADVDRDVTLSSATQWTVEPPHLASFEQGQLTGLAPGEVVLTAQFREHTKSVSLVIDPADSAEEDWQVQPQTLAMTPAEWTTLTVLPGEVKLRASTSDENVAVVELVEGQQRVTAVGNGECSITLEETATGKEVVVPVVVRDEEVERIAIRPESIAIPVGATETLSVVATAGEREFSVTPDAVEWTWAGGGFLEVDVATGVIRGRTPTEAPQTLTANWRGLAADCLVQVHAQPLRLAVEPAGPLELPRGLSAQLSVWTMDGQNRRTPVAANDVEWIVQPLNADSDIETGVSVDGDTVTAVADSGAGVSVTAQYLEQQSDPVEVRPAPPAEGDELEIQWSQLPLFVGDQGALRLQRSQADGLELGDQQAAYRSADPTLLEISEDGQYVAKAPGKVTVSATHTATGWEAETTVTIVSDEATLAFRPSEVTLAVDSQEHVELFVRDGQQEHPVTPDESIQYQLENPTAVQWAPPLLKGSVVADPFKITATHQGRSAELTVTVVEGLAATEADPDSEDGASEEESPLSDALRVQPETATLAIGEPIKPAVEQLVDEQWTEVVPGLVKWTANSEEVVLLDPVGDAPPVVTLLDGIQRSVLFAKYKGHRAKLALQASGESGVDPTAADAGLDVVRSPEGEQLPVGQQQRYELVWRQGDQLRTVDAKDVVWPPAFEDERFAWAPPVLTAKQAGHVQRLNVQVGEASHSIKTISVLAPENQQAAGPGASAPDPPDGPPQRIELKASTPIEFAVGAVWTDYRVTAFWESGEEQDVTGQAALQVVGEPPSSAVRAYADRLVGQSSGTASVAAEFRGVESPPLDVNVLAQLAADELRLQPPQLSLAAGQSTSFRLIAVRKGVSTDITDRADVAWSVEHPPEQAEAVESLGPQVMALQAGHAQVRAKVSLDGTLLSATADVTVGSSSPRRRLSVTPPSLVLRVNESRELGTAVTVHWDGRDVTHQCDLAVADPRVVRHDPSTSSLVGDAAGATEVVFSVGDDRVRLPMRVAGDTDVAQGAVPEIVPGSGTLAPGEKLEVRVYVRDPSGERIDRTSEALLSSDNPEAVAVQGNELLGVAAGAAEITAAVLGTSRPGRATFSVVAADDAQQLAVAPRQATLNVGQPRQVQAYVNYGQRRTNITGHPDLTFASSGNQIHVSPTGLVRGLEPGSATVTVRFKGMTATAGFQVQAADPLRLEIRPRRVLVQEAQMAPVEIWAVRGPHDRRRLTLDDGVSLSSGNLSVAEVEGLTVRGMSVGSTELVASYGATQATAVVRVTPIGGGRRPQAPSFTPGLQFVQRTVHLNVDGVPAPVRVLDVAEDGSVTDVSEWVELTALREGIVAFADGAIQGVAQGQTPIHATYLDRKTTRPLLAAVGMSSAPGSQPQLTVAPNPLVLVAGRSHSPRVQLVSPGGVSAETPFTLSSTSPVVSIQGRSIIALQAGTAVVTAQAQWNGQPLKQALVVEVQPAFDAASPSTPSTGPRAAGRTLTLAGPRDVSVGQLASFRVRLVDGAQSWDMSQQGAQLVVTPLQGMNAAPAVEGMNVTSASAGWVQVQARYRNLASNIIRLQVHGASGPVQSLKLEMSSLPLPIGDTRVVQLTGRANGATRDLTTDLIQGAADLEVAGDRQAVTINGATITAVEEGIVTIRANRQGEASNQVRIHVMAERKETPIQELRARPSRVYLSAGAQAPAIQVEGRAANSSQFHPVPATLTSADPNVLKQQGDVFTAVAPGTTKIIADYQGIQTSIDVEVAGRLFRSVRMMPDSERSDDTGFVVDLEVTATKQSEPIEYQVVRAGERPRDGDWVLATESNGQLRTVLTSPPLKIRFKQLSRLEIFARGQETQRTERYPFAMTLSINDAQPAN